MVELWWQREPPGIHLDQIDADSVMTPSIHLQPASTSAKTCCLAGREWPSPPMSPELHLDDDQHRPVPRQQVYLAKGSS